MGGMPLIFEKNRKDTSEEICQFNCPQSIVDGQTTRVAC